MRHRFVIAIVFGSVFSAVAVSQRHGQADSVQNYSHGVPKSADAAHKQTLPQPSWDVRYKSGSFKLREGQYLKTEFVPTEIVHKTAPSATVSVDQLREAPGPPDPILNIKSDQLRAAYFDAEAEKDSGVNKLLRVKMPLLAVPLLLVNLQEGGCCRNAQLPSSAANA